MARPATTRGRTHDAASAREAILNAAEASFAEHGFAGARSDVIAKASGYNSSLIFHYFGDKLGLYTEVVRRADQELSALQRHALAPLIMDESIAQDAHAFKALLTALVATYFDYAVTHPRFIRTLLWEQASGWQTYTNIASQLASQEGYLFQGVFDQAYRAGYLRSNFAPLIQVTLILQICISYLSHIPMYELVLDTGEGLASPESLARAREQITAFVIHGLMTEITETPA